MITHEQNNRTWWIIPVPKNTKEIVFDNQNNILYGQTSRPKPNVRENFAIAMPEEYTYSEPFLLSEATVEMAKKVVQIFNSGIYLDYSEPEEYFLDAVLSLNSLCLHHYPKHTGDFAIIEQIKII